MSKFVAEMLKMIKRDKQLGLPSDTKIGEFMAMSRQHIAREKKNSGKYPKVEEKLRAFFPKQAEEVDKLLLKKYATHEVPVHLLKDTSPTYQPARTSGDSALADTAKLEQKILSIELRLNAFIEYTAKKDAKGNPKKEKEIVDKFNLTTPSSQSISKKAKKNPLKK